MRKFLFLLVLVALVWGTAVIASRTILAEEEFACSDYCPGPREQYLVKVIPVKDDILCRILGGTPETYTGWGEFHICRVR